MSAEIPATGTSAESSDGPDPIIETALAELPEDLEPLALGARLRRRLPPPVARHAAELHALRRRAARKLAGAQELWLTPKGLEQASDRRVARERARRIRTWFDGPGAGARLLDATAGIGGDSLALLEEGLGGFLAADACPRTARYLAENLRRRARSLGLEPPRVLCARFESVAVEHDALLVDPDRRPGQRSGRGRAGNPETWSPAWSAVRRALATVRAAAIKLPPAVEVEPLAARLPAELAASWTWTSLGGELKVVCLWTGELASAPGAREVVLLDTDGQAVHWSAEPVRVAALEGQRSEAPAWIAEPDPAVIRSGLLGALAREQGLAPLAPEIAYLGGERAPRSPLLRAYEVLGGAPLDRRRVRRLLAEHDVGPLVVKKRGHPEPAEALARRFAGSGSRRGVLVVARLASGHRAWLVRPVQPVG